ncbi:hypothetical protein [Brevibacillus brevis]|uniref:hypothetical protein n=1 Tax=Brevibacillus brevis TaxID=1393 RepID=UPI00165E302E|nr:hypothetical protein [Brevibacillus brevis]
MEHYLNIRKLTEEQKIKVRTALNHSEWKIFMESSGLQSPDLPSDKIAHLGVHCSANEAVIFPAEYTDGGQGVCNECGLPIQLVFERTL